MGLHFGVLRRRRAFAAISTSSLAVPLLWACTSTDLPTGAVGHRDAAVTPRFASTTEMMDWIRLVTEQGVRRAGYPADEWTEQWAKDRFTEIGLENVTLEPVDAVAWKPGKCSIEAWPDADPAAVVVLPCFGLPYSKPASGFVAPLAELESGNVAGKVAVSTATFMDLPMTLMRTFATRSYDPTGEFESLKHMLPFTTAILNVMEPTIQAGAGAFVGVLDLPWETHDYFVPYDALMRPIPGVWLSKSNGAALRAVMAKGPASARVAMEAETPTVTTYNVVGSLPGASNERIIVGSHHDGPWASAVEDASGISLVLAQASYWSQVPREMRPFSMKFLLQAAHVSGFPGADRYVEEHRAELDDVVVEIHLEHVARRCNAEAGELVPTPDPEVRWWFTSTARTLEDAIESALHEHELGRSLIMPPTALGDAPPTDGSRFYIAGVPIMNFLTAPMYLFDSRDTVDKVHEESLVPITKAVVDFMEQLRGHTAAGIRSEIRADGGAPGP
jgi:hypothetical protein